MRILYYTERDGAKSGPTKEANLVDQDGEFQMIGVHKTVPLGRVSSVELMKSEAENPVVRVVTEQGIYCMSVPWVIPGAEGVSLRNKEATIRLARTLREKARLG
jgi:hypothetical protein